MRSIVLLALLASLRAVAAIPPTVPRTGRDNTDDGAGGGRAARGARGARGVGRGVGGRAARGGARGRGRGGIRGSLTDVDSPPRVVTISMTVTPYTNVGGVEVPDDERMRAAEDVLNEIRASALLRHADGQAHTTPHWLGAGVWQLLTAILPHVTA